jgi:outer membrane protein OmpA-like peptidoglycan-associated protein
MKMFSLYSIIGGAAAGCLFFTTMGVNAQTSPSDQQIAREQADLEKKRLDLEKRSLELQQREADLDRARQELQNQQSAQSLSMNLSGDVLFDYDKVALKPAAEDALKKVAVVLSQFPESMVTVEGYTDSKGTKSVNMQLSQARAGAVKDWLVKNGNIPAATITAKGFGEDNPVASNQKCRRQR